MLSRLRSVLALTSLSLCFITTARADEAPPEGPCDFRELGEACSENGDDGICVKHSCSRLSYAGGQPETVAYDCLRCDTAAKEPAVSKGEPVASATPPSKEQKSSCSIDPTLGGSSLLLFGLAFLRRRR